MSETHTPGTWCALNSGIYADVRTRQRLVADTYAPGGRKGEMEANAERIVLCCNAHDDLVAAIEQVLDDMGEAGLSCCQAAKDMMIAALAKAGEK